jgi:aspartyl/asparaginyl-tRNA synthetase
MIEPEIAFCDLPGDMACAEAYVQFCIRAALKECHSDLLFLQARVDLNPSFLPQITVFILFYFIGGCAGTL